MPKMSKKSQNMAGFDLGSTNMDFMKQAMMPENDQKEGKVQNADGANEWMKEFDPELPNDMPSVFDPVKTADKRKANLESDVPLSTWKKKFGVVMKKQADKRKRGQESVLHGLQTMVTRLEADTAVLNENSVRLREWCSTLIKQNQQSVQANRQKLDALRQIIEAYTKDCENAEASQQQETRALEQELAASVQELQERLQKDCRRKNAEAMRKAMSMMLD